MSPIDAAAILGRFLQFAGACVLAGAALFFLYGVAPDRFARWPSRLVAGAAALGAIGVVAWLMAQAASFGEAGRDAVDPAKVWGVAAETGFGRVALLRLVLFVVALHLSPLAARGRGVWLALAAVGAIAAASFAWTGHGGRDEGLAGVLHQSADVLHLLAASIWIGALAGLTALLVLASRNPGAGRAALTGLVRFSGIGLAVVAVLIASGLVNSWLLVGPAAVPRMLTSPYGQLLIAKLALFAVMLALAAANRYRHAPRLERALQGAGADAATIRPVLASVLTETGLAVAVLILVSWLGTLAPPIEG
jgi:copper resistance protein D